MKRNEQKLYEICKSLELYQGYTEGIMDTVQETEDIEELISYYEKNKPNESDFLMYATYLGIKREEPNRIIEDD